MKMTWKLMKEIVKELRIKQRRLMKKQGGLNELMVAISLIRRADMTRMYFYPHGINLITGFADVYCYENYSTSHFSVQRINIKRMLSE